MVYVFLADGFEETEALTPVDVLRRAGVTVQTVGVTGKIVTGSHGITVLADMELSQITLNNNLQAVVLPGGMPGTTNLEKTQAVLDAVSYASEHNLIIGAICAAPSVLGHMGLLEGKEAISFPGFEQELTGAEISQHYVCRDGNIITARGMGVATEFGLALTAALRGRETAEKTFQTLQCVKRCEI